MKHLIVILITLASGIAAAQPLPLDGKYQIVWTEEQTEEGYKSCASKHELETVSVFPFSPGDNCNLTPIFTPDKMAGWKTTCNIGHIPNSPLNKVHVIHVVRQIYENSNDLHVVMTILSEPKAGKQCMTTYAGQMHYLGPYLDDTL